MEKIPERLRWAVDRLGLTGDETILEIGCGRGVAVSLVCPQLGSGTITAIDRSATAIEAALTRNAAAVAAGKAIFRQASIEEFDGAAGAFDVVFAVNVNLFWLDAARGLASVRRLLSEKGKLFLLYEPPSPDQRERMAKAIPEKLAAGGFEVLEIAAADIGRASLLAAVARPSPHTRGG